MKIRFVYVFILIIVVIFGHFFYFTR